MTKTLLGNNMSSTSTSTPTPESSATPFASFMDFLQSNPQTKNLIDQGVRTGSVCSINLSDMPLDIELDAQVSPVEKAQVGTRKVK